MNHLPLIIKREYLTKVKNKSFIIMTILSPIILMALFAVVAYLSQLNNNKERTISILDESGQISVIFKNTENTKYTMLEDMSLKEAKDLVELNGNYGLLHIPNNTNLDNIAQDIRFYSEDTPSLTVISRIESKLEKKITDLKLQQAGVDIAQIKASKTYIDVVQESYQGEKTSKMDNVIKLAFGGFAGYLLFMFIINILHFLLVLPRKKNIVEKVLLR